MLYIILYRANIVFEYIVAAAAADAALCVTSPRCGAMAALHAATCSA